MAGAETSDSAADRTARLAARALRLHARCRGKIQMQAKEPVGSLEDLAVWYSPGVAEPCRAIAADPAVVLSYTNRANTIAIVSDGTRVLGLGDTGPEACLQGAAVQAIGWRGRGAVVHPGARAGRHRARRGND
jgi:malate dehydrogenase (oxaloacetate-decarboxylating)